MKVRVPQHLTEIGILSFIWFWVCVCVCGCLCEGSFVVCFCWFLVGVFWLVGF